MGADRHGGAPADGPRSSDERAVAAAVAAEVRAAREEDLSLLADVPGRDAAPSGLTLRRRAMETLSWGPADLAWIAMRLEVPEPTALRLLGRLRDDGLVTPLAAPDGGAETRYDVTAHGEHWLARHALYGTPQEPPGPQG